MNWHRPVRVFCFVLLPFFAAFSVLDFRAGQDMYGLAGAAGCALLLAVVSVPRQRSGSRSARCECCRSRFPSVSPSGRCGPCDSKYNPVAG